jgi:hypothetical protein
MRVVPESSRKTLLQGINLAKIKHRADFPAYSKVQVLFSPLWDLPGVQHIIDTCFGRAGDKPGASSLYSELQPQP